MTLDRLEERKNQTHLAGVVVWLSSVSFTSTQEEWRSAIPVYNLTGSYLVLGVQCLKKINTSVLTKIQRLLGLWK